MSTTHQRSSIPSQRTRLSALTLTVAFAAALVVPSVSAPAPANAAIDATGWWYPAMGVDDAHAAGWTGEGVKIAVIESHFNPDAPAVAGANVSVNQSFECGGTPGVTTETSDDALHGVGVVQMLAGPFGLDGDVGGIAPKAAIEVFTLGGPDCLLTDIDSNDQSPLGRAIIGAVDAGNDIISISYGQTPFSGDYEAIAYAIAHDVVVVSSSPNKLDQQHLLYPVGANGVVSVAAVAGNLDLLDDNGTAVITPEITVVAPGISVGTVGKTGDWSGLSTSNGSSVSAPLVAGALALTKQKFPDATGNQLIHALINSTASAQNNLGRDTVNGYGYGLISLAALLMSDPLSYPNENPLMDKSFGMPTEADVAAVKGITPPPTKEPTESASPQPSKTADGGDEQPSTPGEVVSDGPGALPWVIGGAIMVVGVGIIVFSVMRFRRDAGRS
ncbi:S8 family serine peptidase [Microbacterium sp. NC79]|uniref:S8 family peptidase n=1 Tax=Microbacterium sp. NC79 TaxID=2851009 RepID=UPI001C2C7899|nr:S8 family serine peptidase [Microbacterium sp. NC79]MBV0894046.1 S8 family serine peptidase [Microbacterium sp. NC79]